MNALWKRNAAWNWFPPRRKVKRRQLGFALYEAGRRPGVPARVANAHARFEYEARQALRLAVAVTGDFAGCARPA